MDDFAERPWMGSQRFSNAVSLLVVAISMHLMRGTCPSILDTIWRSNNP
ncbi:hypothetical protein ACFO4O_04945 [Glaciecola siphonariae]|uniref:Uncharacterized protein n=1 Tax=Glaciecola siphonariae TaxID=521012 RepID=A0ABV9LSN1_9ALTE